MASKEALDLKALASERFWENKAECDDAEKKYVLSLNSAKVDEEVSVPFIQYIRDFLVLIN